MSKLVYLLRPELEWLRRLSLFMLMNLGDAVTCIAPGKSCTKK